ncbi:MAG TPA: hypothetical protein VFB90_00515 [Dehalococcoidia bacterium]|nr:hypothetical protein [Dehalococcoidia bacterium]
MATVVSIGLLALLSAGMLACGSKTEGGPEATAQQFYERVARQDVAGVLELTCPEDIVSMKAGPYLRYANAGVNTNQLVLEDVRVRVINGSADRATVRLTGRIDAEPSFAYPNIDETLFLKREDGHWCVTTEQSPPDAQPHVGDHWHALYQVSICGAIQPPIPVFEDAEGVHTHGDGVIHIHPFNAAGEGPGARLVKFFEYAGGELSKDQLRMPGDSRTYRSGETCGTGQPPSRMQIFVNDGRGEKTIDDLESYIPQDGDFIRIVFGPPVLFSY